MFEEIEIRELKELILEHFQENSIDISMEYIDKIINEDILGVAYENAYLYVDEEEDIHQDVVNFTVKYFVVGYLAEHISIQYCFDNDLDIDF